ncbi:MAG: cytochrome c-type biogenesis protein CcmH [Acidimicrobiia bacterium]|nr:cytochrome c-type biogenesis protein CcmH [Acidimicrobiia bacterium]
MSDSIRKIVAAVVTIGLAVVVVVGLVQGDRTDEDRARSIGSRVKCPVCQGVAIADSPSETARAMMDVVEERIADGWSDRQIIDYFSERYTDSIVIDPPFSGNTLLVWLLPILAVVAGFFMIFSRRKTPVPKTDEVKQ